MQIKKLDVINGTEWYEFHGSDLSTGHIFNHDEFGHTEEDIIINSDEEPASDIETKAIRTALATYSLISHLLSH